MFSLLLSFTQLNVYLLFSVTTKRDVQSFVTLKGFGFLHDVSKTLLSLYLFFYKLGSSSFLGGFQEELAVVCYWLHLLGLLFCCQGVTRGRDGAPSDKGCSRKKLLLGLERWLSVGSTGCSGAGPGFGS